VTDIVVRLREHAQWISEDHRQTSDAKVMHQAADEIERLRAVVARKP
jgi:hypothetical protein